MPLPPLPNAPDRSRLRLVLALASTSLLGACIMVPVGRRYGGGREVDAYDDDDVVTMAPPPPQADMVVMAPGPGYFWIGGHWGWFGGRHAWIGGRWEAHRPGWRWSPFAWQRHRHGWRANPGRWNRY